MARIKLTKKHKAARLSTERDVVETWLMKLEAMSDHTRVSDTYRFERLSNDVLKLAEVISSPGGEVTEADRSDLQTIAEKLIIAEEAREVQDEKGLMVAELNTI